ncbi:MAG: alpha/beta hydrolase [bacterium]|nr:alpha/beta hydrolase [bacterium]
MGFEQIDGLTIHYEAAHDPTAPIGQRVLYVHGTGCNSKVWTQHMASLAEAHTPVAIDLPGHGQSGGDGFRGMADHAHYVMGLAATLGWDQFVLAGHSMGGGVALTAALYYPERLKALMLIDTGARLRVAPSILQASRQAAQSGQRRAPDRTWGYARSTPLTVVQAVYDMTADTRLEVTHKDWICDDTFDAISRVKDIDTPALAVCGDEDNLTPVKYHKYLRDQMPNCTMEIIHQAGHWTYLEQPEAFTGVVKAFLDRLPR